MRFACSTASFPEDRLQIAVAKVGWCGYEGLELALGAGDPPSAQEVRERLRANDLELVAVRAGTLPPSSDGAGLDELARIGRAAALARELDCSLVVVEAPAHGTLPDLVGGLRMLDRALGEAAVDVCVVNALGTLLNDPIAIQELWKVVGLPERVGLALDPGHAVLAGWNPAELDALPELPRHVYLNDARAGRITPPGDGDLDLGALGEALKLRGYGGNLSLLLENADPWAVEPIAKEIRVQAEVWFS